MQWAFNGTVIFKKRDEDAKMKELSFKTGYVVELSENFDSVGGNPMTMTFTISARTVSMGGENLENDWPM